jgi:ABC-type nitrate/sulfonate/bicarbonate transport system substrate-binding protein
MAKEKGYYRDAGLEVDIVEASPEIDSISEVLEKRAMFGVASSELALARAKGKRYSGFGA